MIDIIKVDHVGIRVSDKNKSIDFYKLLGFDFVADGGFEKGHPVIMRHQSGVVINLLGPAKYTEKNILMGEETKYAGYTHISLEVRSLDEARKNFDKMKIPITGSFTFGNMRAMFIRDPDKNVIEFDEYTNKERGNEPETQTDFKGYSSHPN